MTSPDGHDSSREDDQDISLTARPTRQGVEQLLLATADIGGVAPAPDPVHTYGGGEQRPAAPPIAPWLSADFHAPEHGARRSEPRVERNAVTAAAGTPDVPHATSQPPVAAHEPPTDPPAAVVWREPVAGPPQAAPSGGLLARVRERIAVQVALRRSPREPVEDDSVEVVSGVGAPTWARRRRSPVADVEDEVVDGLPQAAAEPAAEVFHPRPRWEAPAEPAMTSDPQTAMDAGTGDEPDVPHESSGKVSARTGLGMTGDDAAAPPDSVATMPASVPSDRRADPGTGGDPAAMSDGMEREFHPRPRWQMTAASLHPAEMPDAPVSGTVGDPAPWEPASLLPDVAETLPEWDDVTALVDDDVPPPPSEQPAAARGHRPLFLRWAAGLVRPEADDDVPPPPNDPPAEAREHRSLLRRGAGEVQSEQDEEDINLLGVAADEKPAPPLTNFPHDALRDGTLRSPLGSPRGHRRDAQYRFIPQPSAVGAEAKATRTRPLASVAPAVGRAFGAIPRPSGPPRVGRIQVTRNVAIAGAAVVVLLAGGLLTGKTVTRPHAPAAAVATHQPVHPAPAVTHPSAAPAAPTAAPTPKPQAVSLTKVQAAVNGTDASGVSYSTQDIRYGLHPNDFRIVLDMTGAGSGPKAVVGFNSANPEEMYVVVDQTSAPASLAQSQPGAGGLVTSVTTVASATKGQTVYIFHLSRAASLVNAPYYLGSPLRLVIDIN